MYDVFVKVYMTPNISFQQIKSEYSLQVHEYVFRHSFKHNPVYIVLLKIKI